jgi:hypothetical protein
MSNSHPRQPNERVIEIAVPEQPILALLFVLFFQLVFLPFRIAGFFLSLPFKAWRFVFGKPAVAEAPFASRVQEEAYMSVKREYRRKRAFMNHAYAYMFINGMAWVGTLSNPFSRNVDGVVFFTLFWGMLLAFHYFRTRLNREEDQRLLDVLYDIGAGDVGDKRKRQAYEDTYGYDEAPVRLQDLLEDDGEIAPEWDERASTRRKRR